MADARGQDLEVFFGGGASSQVGVVVVVEQAGGGVVVDLVFVVARQGVFLAEGAGVVCEGLPPVGGFLVDGDGDLDEGVTVGE